MWDILTFHHFIAQDVLIFFYYIGAVVIAPILYYYKNRIVKYLNQKGLKISLSAKEKRLTIAVLLAMFLCMELCWRMMFEAMIGYFDMHDFLYDIAAKIGH